MITTLSAANAYAKAQKSLGVDAGIGGAAPAVQGGGFGDLLKNVMSQTVETSRNAERQMVNQVQGKAELIDVVTAVQAAEQSLETVMAVRDQVISAYQEIMRMPI